MDAEPKAFKAATLQYCGAKTWQENLPIVNQLIHAAHQAGAEFILLPECANSVNLAADYRDYVTQDADPFLQTMQKLAQELAVSLSIGSLILAHESQKKCVNRGITIGADGAIICHYDKIHLFDINLATHDRNYCESDKFTHGTQAVIADTLCGKIGMSICYDVRFANLYTALAQAGALAITVPAAFTAVTGKAHWEVLLRARAIENGVYILAAAQGGTHQDGRKTWGHTMIIDPWGSIIAEADIDAVNQTGFAIADIRPAMQTRVQNSIPRLTQIKEFSAAD